VTLMGDSLRAAYVEAHLLPAFRCAGPDAVTVWADGVDERTRKTGQLLAEALAPGCDIQTLWAGGVTRDPIFSGDDSAECKLDPDRAKAETDAALAGPAGQMDTKAAVARLQAILAPNACAGGAGMCLTSPEAQSDHNMAFPPASSLSEDLLLEYADGKPLGEVGWGRATGADIAAVMPSHERSFAILRAQTGFASTYGAKMARVILGALAGEPVRGGPQSGPSLKLLGLAGHDTNLVLMASVFGLSWTLPDEPDGTAPSTALAFELWSDGGKDYVRPVIFYETLDQLRTLSPKRARELPLTIKDCASGPMGSCPLEQVRQRVEALLPKDCL
jgi:4-phytase/acid phosphatase